MCKSPLHPLLAALPKCEHHMHLEGSLSPELLFELAAKNKITLPQDDPAFESVEALYARYDRFSSLDDFLKYYYVGFTVLVDQSDYEALAYAYLARAHAASVRHAEVFFDPQEHLARGIELETIIGGFAAAVRRARADFSSSPSSSSSSSSSSDGDDQQESGGGPTALLIPCLLRHLPVENSAAVFAQMRDAGYFADGTLAGLGLCSTELGQPPSAWRAVFAEAAAAGVRRTAHAGEEGPASYVAGALDELGAQRIDHGVRAAEDPAVVARLAREGVLLSVCPLSNVRLGGAPGGVVDVPVRKLLDAGVPFSINSDDPAYFGGYILENYCAVQEAHELTADEWATVARNSVHGSWCAQDRKDTILREIEAVLADWTGGRPAIEVS